MGTRARTTLILVLRLCAAAVMICAAPVLEAAPSPSVIPVPHSMEIKAGSFVLTRDTGLVVTTGDEDALATARTLRSTLARLSGCPLTIRTGSATDRAIVFERTPASPAAGADAYTLDVTPERITLTAADAAGLFYAGVTLAQLIERSGPASAAVPALKIEDRPRFAWRGLMLDSARHWQTPGFVRALIDRMAFYKLNVLHWHLTDDQGWRLEIRSHPALTRVGAWRVPAGRAAARDLDPRTGAPRRYGGYYSQATVRELVAYAAARHVTIVPEVDLPGHMSAAMAAETALGTVPVPAVPSDWGIFPNVLSPEEGTFRFLEDVFGELLELFPSKMIHVGGDEVPPDQWSNSPQARTRAAALGLPGPDALHGYFIQRMQRFLASRGRRLVGWDEDLEPGLSTDAVIMSWRGTTGAVSAARQGYDTVLAPDPTLYLDHRQSDAADEPPGRADPLTLADVYQFSSQLDEMSGDTLHRVLGVQANLWTEHVRTEERAWHMIWPRAAALAEVGWSDAARQNFSGFAARLARLQASERVLGRPGADSAFAVRVHPRYESGAGTVTVELGTQVSLGEIRYTLDGTKPGPTSFRYQQAFTAPLPVTVKAASFAGDQRLSAARVATLSLATQTRRSSQVLELCTRKVALALEDDAPVRGPRAVFLIDLENPCWIYKDADLGHATRFVAAVGQVPFNFQIGADREQIHFPQPVSPDGELEVRMDRCDGELLARLPLKPAVDSDTVTRLDGAIISPRGGHHDLCLRFAQPTLDPMWAIDWVELPAVDSTSP